MGVIIAIVISISWTVHLIYCLSSVNAAFDSISVYLHILIQAYLYTGLFITAHDAMHGNISQNKNVNLIFGKMCSFLFAALSYKKLLSNHMIHHAYPGTAKDPDFFTSSHKFFSWWLVFLKRYVSVLQIITMAIVFNLMKIFYNEVSIWVFFVLPVLLSTFQLFFFGTYLPHRLPHDEHMYPHNSRTQKKNHIFAMLSCYFFGYHSEHHTSPKTAWWKLYKLK